MPGLNVLLSDNDSHSYNFRHLSLLLRELKIHKLSLALDFLFLLLDAESNPLPTIKSLY
jgi:hypothetical protein